MDNKTPIHERPWFIGIMLFFFWPVGLALLWHSSKISKIVKLIVTAIMIFFFLLWYSTPKPIPQDSATTETSPALINAEPEKKLSETPPVIINKRTTAIGSSNKNINDLSIALSSSVRNDKTGNWKLARFNKPEDFVYYAKSYANKFFKNDNEVHAVINLAYKTTTAVRKSGDVLDITVHEYINKEEYDAQKLFGGMVLAHYLVYLDNGDIEQLN